MPESTTPPPRPNPIILRSARDNDAPQIAHLGSTVFSTTFGYSLPASDLSDYLSSAYSPLSISKDIANPNTTIIVAHPEGNEELVVGFAQLTGGTHEECVKGEKPVELQRLYVSTEWAGKGVGRLLVERVVELAKEKGKRTLWLGVWEENLKAQAVYRKLGFEKVGDHDFVMGSCVQTDWIMSKSL